MRRKFLLLSISAMLLVGAALTPSIGRSEGALAIAKVPGWIVFGAAANRESVDKAKASALRECRERAGKEGKPKLKAACRVVVTLHDQCLATAGKKGTTRNASWALGPDKATAEARAIAKAKCGRFCSVSSGCDTARKPSTAQ